MNSLADAYLLNVAGGLWVRFSLDLCFKASLLLLLSFSLYYVFRRSTSAFRHLLLTLVFLSLFLLPLGSLVGPQWRLPLFPSPSRIGVGPAFASGASSLYVAAAICGIWAIGFAVVLFRLVAGLWATRRLIQNSVPLDEDWAPFIRDAVSALGFKRSIPVRLQANLGAAICAGVLRPVVLVPLAAEDWSPEQCRVILRHEFSHVRRHDNLTNVLALLVCALYWFNPLVWWAAERLRVCREGACDDLVLDAGVKPSQYVSFLLEATSPRKSALLAVALSQVSALKARLLTILDPRVNRARLRLLQVIPSLFLAGLALVSLAGLQPWITPAFRAALDTPLLFGPLAGNPFASADHSVFAGAVRTGSIPADLTFVRVPESLPDRLPSFASSESPDVVTIGGSSPQPGRSFAGFRTSSRPVFVPADPRFPAFLRPTGGGLWNRPGTAAHEDDPQQPAGGQQPDTHEPPAQQATALKLTRLDIGTLGGMKSVAADINETGQVVGESTTGAGETKPFLWAKDTGILDLPCPGSDCRAIDINDAGQVLIVASDAGKDRSYVWSEDQGLVDLGTLGGISTEAVAFNEKGQVAGSSLTSFGMRNAFFWSAETGMINLGGQHAIALNERGQVIASASSYSFFWDPADGGFYRLGQLDVAATPLALNNDGEVVGYATFSKGAKPQAFFWTAADGMFVLDFPAASEGSCAFRINDAGEVLALSRSAGSDEVYLWNKDTGSRAADIPDILLPSPDWSEMTGSSKPVVLVGSNLPSFHLAEELARLDFDSDQADTVSEPVKINGRGQIAGNLVSSGDRVEAVVWEIRLLDVEESLFNLLDKIESAKAGHDGQVWNELIANLSESFESLQLNDYQGAAGRLAAFLAVLEDHPKLVPETVVSAWVEEVWKNLDRLSEFTILSS